ncbi:leucine-rich repeat-containing protein 74B [Tachysurus ichikawai]
MVGKKVAREMLLSSVCEDDGDEGHEEEMIGGIRSRPPSRPRNIYSRGSVDTQAVIRASGCSRREQRSEDEDGVDKNDEEEEEEEEGGRSSEAVDGQEGANAGFTADEDYDTDLEPEGEILGPAIAENTGLKSLSLAWNSIRGNGAIALAKGLVANIFLQSVDLSYNGLATEGATTLGEGLKDNNTLEELNISINRIPPEGAVHLAVGLKANNNLRILNMARNPVRPAGCLALLKAIEENPSSSMEYLDFSDISVDQEFEELLNSIKDTLPNFRVKHGGTLRKPFQKP